MVKKKSDQKNIIKNEVLKLTLSNYYVDEYRSTGKIKIQIQDVVDAFLFFMDSKLDKNQSKAINKLKSLELQITTQIMHIFEAPLDNHDFKDLVKQIIDHVLHELIERAYNTGIINKDESILLKKALNESNELELCSIYNPKYLK